MLSETQILERLRKTCFALEDVDETTTFGHPTFRVKGEMFAVLEEYKGELGICVKVEKELQGIFLDDSRFFPHALYRQAWMGHAESLCGAAQLDGGQRSRA